jgi:deoxyhypusine synthase
MTVDSPEYGGLSGATPEEAVSWGKVRDAQQNCVVVNSCCSILFPLLSKYALELNLAREKKRIMQRKGDYLEKLINHAKDNKKFRENYRNVIDRL